MEDETRDHEVVKVLGRPYGQKTQHSLVKYKKTKLPNFGKQI